MKKKKQIKDEYPSICCQKCGSSVSEKGQFQVSTWYMGKCEICGEVKECTELRDFYHPTSENIQKFRLKLKLKKEKS